MFTSLLLTFLLAYSVWTLACLELNVRKARALRVPIVRTPFGGNNYLWVILQPFLWAILDLLPIPWASYPDFVRFSHRNWQFLEKSHPTESFGSVWVLVSPAGTSLHFSDPDTIEEIYSRWRDFIRPVQKYRMLAIYGPSVFTVGLDDWPRHRKAVAAPFSEDLMNLVWEETLRYTKGMLHEWTTEAEGNVPSLEGDLRALTFNVLAATAFPAPNRSMGAAEPEDGEATTANYREVLHVVLDNAILLMLVPYRYLTGRLVPKSLARIGRAAASYKSILMKVISDEAAALNHKGAGPDDLLTPLVRALERTTVGEDRTKTKKGGLSADETLGNIFTIHFAGHDTVLITLTFALTLLAVHSDVQEWLREEINTVSQGRPSDAWTYNDFFPRLKRCHAVLLETLRLYAPITGVPKIASEKAPVIRVDGGRVLAIPSGVEIFPLLLGVQTDPRYWEDPYEWRPSRWIKMLPGGDEELLIPRKGTFFPWSDGPQICVGKKFSQVEGVAMLARLFHGHCLRLEGEAGETVENTRKRARANVDDVNYNLLLRMNHPERVRLSCAKMGSGLD